MQKVALSQPKQVCEIQLLKRYAYLYKEHGYNENVKLWFDATFTAISPSVSKSEKNSFGFLSVWFGLVSDCISKH